MLLGVLLDLLLIGAAMIGADSPLKMPGGAVALATVAPLLLYGFVFLRVTATRAPKASRALRIGTGFGVGGGVIQVIHMALENFGSRLGENPPLTLAFMFGGFVVWGVSGYCAARWTGQWTGGPIAGCWSGLISVLVAVTFGLILMTANIPSPAYIATWREYLESGWTNARAFGIENSLEAALGHLMIGPAAGAVFGLIGGGMAKLAVRQPQTAPGG
jgi:hypothetical protein